MASQVLGARSQRARVLRAAACLALFLLAGCGSGEEPAGTGARGPIPAASRGPRPDIVLVSIDSLRRDHVGCYGYGKPTTPTIDRLAAEGVRFDSAVSSTSWTLPAHVSLLTGLYSETHGLVDNGLAMSPGLVTLAKVLKGAGYRTAGFYAGPYLDPAYGFDRGFDTYVSSMSDLPGGRLQDAAGDDPEGPAVRSFSDITGPRTVEEATRWLGTLDDRPFFLFIHLWDVHYDYIPPDDYRRMFDPDYRGTLDARHVMRNPDVKAGMPKRDFDHLIALYDGEIRFTDDNLGRILDEIARRGRLESALVVVTADHGDEFFEHGEKGHQKSLYDEVLRIPLVVRWSGAIPAGKAVADQVGLVDVMPTILSLAGVPIGTEIDGRDVSPLIRGETLEPLPVLCDLQVRGKPHLRGFRTNDRKFITFPVKHWWQFGYQLFDLTSDPGERHVLSILGGGFFDARSTLKRLRRESKDLSARLGGTVVQGPESLKELDERLRSLGYIDTPK